MAEPTIGRMVFIQNPLRRERELGVTDDEKSIERYVLGLHKERLDDYARVLRERRAARKSKGSEGLP